MSAALALPPMTAGDYHSFAFNTLAELREELVRCQSDSQQPEISRRLMFCLAVLRQRGDMEPERVEKMADEVLLYKFERLDNSARRLLGFLQGELQRTRPPKSAA